MTVDYSELHRVQQEHSVSIARLEERDKARDVAIEKIAKDVSWTFRGLIIVLLTVVGELVVLVAKK